MQIDITFDHRLDASGKDPDSASATLKIHHQTLWSKPLPSGEKFELAPERGSYLVLRSNRGQFVLSSDAISNSLRGHKRLANIIDQIPAQSLDAFQWLGATIGARIVFPAKRIQNRPTINVARGFNAKIRDRFDLTLECIRLHYLGLPSPLASALDRYDDFFALFESFNGYVEFFLLQDIAKDGEIDFFLPFTSDFSTPVLPNTVDKYQNYMANSMHFIEARNQRILGWANRQI